MSFFDVASSLGAWDYLRLGDASGTVAQDSTANNRDGTYVGCTLGQPGLLVGQAGTSVRLDGVDDRITLPAPIYSPAHTVVFLMKSSDVQTAQAIYHEGNSGNDVPMWLLASDGVRASPSHLRVYVRGDDNVALLSTTLGSGISSVTPVHDGQVHLIIWEDAISSTNTSQRAYKLHVDDATGNNPQRSGTYAVSTITLNRATWGAFGRTTYADFWAGTLQEVIRLKRILTVAEKQQLFAELRAPSIGLPTKRVWIPSQNTWIAKPIRRWIPAQQKWEGNVVIPPEEPPEEEPEEPLPPGSGALPTTISTYECISVTWDPAGGSSSNVATLRYRVSGTTAWKQAQNLTWIGSEYRGSIVGLTAGTTYQIECDLTTGTPFQIIEASTWANVKPIAQTITLPASSTSMLTISSGGTAAGYILYQPSGASATIDVNNAAAHCIRVTAPYVILKGITCIDAQIDGISIENTNDVIVEGCDVSSWGRRFASEPYGINRDAGVRITGSTRITVQGNRIHHPRWDTNSWEEETAQVAEDAGTWHPNGPHAITWTDDPGGNHVIRYNTIDTDDTHYFNDNFGGSSSNPAVLCFNDTDIYGNYLERGWDNPIQIEAACRNTRVWNNFITRSYSPIGMADIGEGPAYVWRNISEYSIYSFAAHAASEHRGRMFKIRGTTGRAFIYHNTCLQPAALSGIPNSPRGVRICIGQVGASSGYTSRNNIWYADPVNGLDSVSADTGSSSFDYDLYNDTVPSGQESNGINAAPTFETGLYSLVPGSPGYDDGLVLPNFNDGFIGARPDMGAQEQGAPLLKWGRENFTTSAVTTLPPPPPPPPTGATVSLWAASAGSDDPRRVNIAAKINTASLSCRAVVSTTENLVTPVFSPAVTADSQGAVKLSIADLTVATNYWYALEINGRIDANKKGRFRTAPNKVPTSFSFTFHNCAEFDSNAVIFDTITADAADLHIITDDISYWHEKPGVPDPMLVADFRNQFDAVLAQVRPAALWANRNVYTAMGDHSYGVDGGNSTMATKNAAQQVYQEKVPHPTLPIAGSLNYSFGWGQVLFIVIDDRANRSGATMLGTNQKAWVKSQLSRNDYKLKILVTPSVWNADSTVVDDWGGFIAERNELRDYMNASGFGQLAILSGSMHGLAYGDGSSANSGGFAEYHGGSIDKAASIKGGPWVSSSSGSGKYGRMSVTDTGTTISLGFSGKTGSVSTITSTKTYTYTSSDRWQALLNEHVGFGTFSIPSGTYTVTNLSNAGSGSLRDAASQANRKVTVAPGLTGNLSLGTSMDLPSNWWFDGSDGNILLTSEGLNIVGNNTVVSHLRGRANGANNVAPDFIGVKATGRNFWLHHLTGVGSGDNVGDGYIDVADGAANGTISWCRADNWNKCHSLNDGSNNITMHHNLWRGTFSRHPKCTDGCFCHYFNNWVDNPNSYGCASTRDGRLLLENNIFDGGNADVRCINTLGDADGFVRNAGGNLLLGGASIQTNGPGNVPNAPYSYTLAPANQALMDLLDAEAGWQPR